jgi:hypothetical protein
MTGLVYSIRFLNSWATINKIPWPVIKASQILQHGETGPSRALPEEALNSSDLLQAINSAGIGLRTSPKEINKIKLNRREPVTPLPYSYIPAQMAVRPKNMTQHV